MEPMTKEAVLNTIKSTVHSFLPDSRVLLFGSRVTGDFTKDSDYDLLIITKKTYSPKSQMGWESKIRKALVYAVDAPFDVILQSNKEVSAKKNLNGHIVHYAIQQAVEL